MSELMEWVLMAGSIVLVGALVVRTVHRARALSARIDRYHAEQEARRNGRMPINPYADLADAMGYGSAKEEDEEEWEVKE